MWMLTAWPSLILTSTYWKSREKKCRIELYASTSMVKSVN
jgi:hypothetical protein